MLIPPAGGALLRGAKRHHELFPEVRRVVVPRARRAGGGLGTQALEERVVRQQQAHLLADVVVGVGVDQEGSAALGDLLHAAESRGDARGARREGLCHRKSESFVEGGEHREPGQPVGGPDDVV